MNRRLWLAMSLVFLTIPIFGRAVAPDYPSRVETLYSNSDPVDTDADGLTDQGEVSIFHTDPSVLDTDVDGYSDGTEVMIKSDPNDQLDPAVGLLPVKSTNFPWAWVLTRATGITSYLLLFLMTTIGLLITTGWLYRIMNPNVVWSFHRTLGLTMVVSITLHLTGLLLDSFLNFRVVDILVPFLAPYRPIWVALGVFGFYLFLLIIYTSIFQLQKKAGFWRFTHFFGFVMFILLFLHGILTGTDAHRPWMEAVYWSTGSIVGLLIVYRLIWKFVTRRSVALAVGK